MQKNIKSDWSSKKLNELGFVGRGKSKHRPRNEPSLYGGNYPFIQTGDVKAAELYISEYSQTYNDKGLAQSKLWQKNTLLITIAANIAETAILKKDACFPDSIVGFIADPLKADVRFIKYYIDTIKIQMQSISRGTTQDNLSVDKLLSFDILTPPLPTQQKIASILSTYDDLIENNTRRINILEEMAQTLYHEWFVKFRFPGHEQVKMVESELGLIPEGWKRSKIKDLPIKIIDGDRSKKYPKANEFQKEGILFLNTKNIVDNKLDFSEANFISSEKFDQITKGRLQPLDIVMTTRGSIGKLALFNCKHLTGLINAQMLILRADNQCVYQLFLFYLMCTHDFQECIRGFSSGSAQPQIPIQDLKEIEIICPPVELQIKFSDFTYNINQFIKNIQHKNETLRQTRDLLLPKLISGQIDVENLNIDTLDIAA
ncbi:restriction endonuclease subunit S [Nostoc sp. CENA67]|uniref:Restriction endonuclease subunit S n=1 Tax=Amazonocrinis nigriterrae CENA67 TaxID=2794033 RepID=A0A8J7HUH0_9NOST|nr:restriction endonuclease subunit S [Amazonocrinis nigriterrae]MBH8564405.1 restriction endonuclease subunit S [Amazonocrinis nigriterrae CENA67]